MKEILKIEIATICSVHIIAIILAIIFFMLFYMEAKKDYSLHAFLILQVSIIGWMIFKIFKTVSPTEVSRWWFIVGYYFCACVFEVAFLEFAYSSYKGVGMKKKIRVLLYFIAFMQFLCILTNPYHHLFYASYEFWGDSFGVLFYVHTIIEYGFIIVGFIYGCKVFKRKFKDEKIWYKILISSAIIIPLIINFLYITKILKRFNVFIGIPIIFDITPIVFVFSTLAFVYATFNHEFINLSPILKHEIVHKLETPIGVLDSSCSVIYINLKLNDLFDNKAADVLDCALKKLDIENQIDDVKEIEIAGKVFTMLVKKINTFKETQYLLTLNEITDYKKIQSKILVEQSQLEIRKKELKSTIDTLKITSKIGARNYIAREMHDVIGHSLVVTINLLEVAKLYFRKDKKLSDDALNDSVISLESGITSMNNIVSEEESYTGEKLNKDINKILNLLKNTEIDGKLNFKGRYYSIDEKIYDILNRIILELVTNSLKHSEAKKIFISINIKQTEITMLFMDNGVGREKLILGNGLNGIKDRIALIDGKIEFITSKNEGFMSKINISK